MPREPDIITMKIALIGASGFIGSAVREEALTRGHEVTGLISNPDKIRATHGLTLLKSDALDTRALSAQLMGHDAVVSAFSGHAREDIYGYYMRGIRSIIEATKVAGVARLLVVGGAGSLEIKPGELLIDAPDFPAQWRATAEGARDALSLLRNERALDWTVLSPPPVIHPGTRIGQYRVGADSVIFRENGPSDISTEDYAVALIDELENPRHVRRRFTVAY